MTYQAFYRVYRPQSFRDMSGQTHVKRTLQNALLANKTTHAYLFSGPRGTGKTSTAKIFAKALNCEQAPASEPCNTCATCVSITEGSHTDVIEFDAASNSRVEEMRDIIEKVRFAPASARYKVYIIDEVHMLSTSAFNALLKTLEEPPAHAVFILATTEPHKLPATIISRCQRFDFKRLSSQDILERMQVVLDDIALPYDETALKVIAQAAAGGMRDALSLLDQVVSFSGEKLQLEDALLVTGSIGQDIFYNMTEALRDRNIAYVMEQLETLVADGKDPLRLSEDFITFFRDLLLMQTGPALYDLMELITPEVKFEQLAQSFSQETLYHYIDVLAKTQQEMRFSHHTKIYLETALLKMAHAPTSKAETVQGAATIDPQLNEKVIRLEQQVMQLMQQLQGGHVKQVPQSQQPRQKAGGNTYKAPVGRITEVLKDATKENIQQIKNSWAQAMQQLQKSQSALLAEAEPVAASTSAFVVKFKYDIHCQMVADNYALVATMTQQIAALTGMNIEMLCIPNDQWLSVRETFIRDHGLTKKPTQEEAQQEVSEQRQPYIEDETKMTSQEPHVVEAESLFGKDFIEVVDD